MGNDFIVQCGCDETPQMGMTHINNVLNDNQKPQFQESCFGKFYNLLNYRLIKQLIHMLLLRKCLPCKSVREICLRISTKVLRFSRTKFWIATGLKLLNKDESIDVNKVSTSFINKYFNKFYSISYPRSITTCKKQGGKKTKEVGLSSKASKWKKFIGHEFEFVEVAEGGSYYDLFDLFLRVQFA